MKPTRRQLLAAVFAVPIVGCAAIAAAVRPVSSRYQRGGVVKFVPFPRYACFHFELGKPTRVVYFDEQRRPVELSDALLSRVQLKLP